MNSDYLKRRRNAVAVKSVQTRKQGGKDYSETDAPFVDRLRRMNDPIGSKRAIIISRKITMPSKKSRAMPGWFTASDTPCRHGTAMPGEKKGSTSPGKAQTHTIMKMMNHAHGTLFTYPIQVTTRPIKIIAREEKPTIRTILSTVARAFATDEGTIQRSAPVSRRLEMKTESCRTLKKHLARKSRVCYS